MQENILAAHEILKDEGHSKGIIIKMPVEFAGKKNLFSRLKVFFKPPKRFLLVIAAIFISSLSWAQQYVTVNTVVIPPVNPNISQHVLNGKINVTFKNNTGENFTLYSSMKIERTSPSPFTITIGHYRPQIPIPLNSNAVTALTNAQISDGFGNFIPANLQGTGINLASITDANNNIILPEGNYNICIYALNGNYSEISLGGCASFTIPPVQPVNGVSINTILLPPVNSNIVQSVSTGNVKPALLFNNPFGQNVQVKVFGKIESLSPKPFTISLNPEYNQQQPISLSPSIPVQLTPAQVAGAFGNFNENNLIASGIKFSDLKDANNNFKLPEGVYRICFYARYFSANGLGGYASNQSLGCANFNICYKASPPQFTQPISNFNIQNTIPPVRAASPVIFTWTPPNATCGLNLSSINYDFEIREMFPSQTITDAINNPPVFTKKSLSSSTFLLDTILYKQVLQAGKMYVIRVKANTAINSPVEIGNNGFSQVQAFVYGEAITSPTPTETPAPQRPTTSTIATSAIKGKAVWSFKKTEEELPKQIDNGISLNAQVKPISGAFTVKEVKYAIDPNLSISQKSATVNSNIADKATLTDDYRINGTVENINAAVSGDGNLIEKKDLNISSQNGKITHPLSGAKVLLKGVKSKSLNTNDIRITADAPLKAPAVSLSKQLGMVSVNAANTSNSSKTSNPTSIPNQSIAKFDNVTAISNTYLFTEDKDQEEDLIGSGTTDASGNFTINFIDPKFRNITKYSKLHLTIEHNDFEQSEKYIDIAPPDQNGNIDLGEIQLLAKTYRFTPYVDYMSKFAQNLEIALYCPVQLFNQNPHYAFMGPGNGKGEKKTIAGKQYIKIASVQNGETINKLFYQGSSSNDFIIKISADKKADYTTYIGVVPLKYSSILNSGLGKPVVHEIDESKKVISVKKKYTLKTALPYIYGNIKATGDGIIPLSNAMVTVTFDESKTVDNDGSNLIAPDKPATNPPSSKPATAAKNTNTSNVKSSITNVSSGSIANSVMAPSSFLLELNRYTAFTDEDGNYRIDNLPVLAEGAQFTVKVTSNDPDVEQELKLDRKLRGDSLLGNFDIKPEKITITGIVVDDKELPLQNAQLKWKKAGGSPIEANESGLFITSSIFSKDSLIISRPGYLTKTIFVDIKSIKDNKDKVKNIKETTVVKSTTTDAKINTWATTLTSQPSIQQMVSKGNTGITSTAFGYAVNKSAEAPANNLSVQLKPVYQDLFNSRETNTGFNDLGKVGRLEKGFAKINFIVMDAKTKLPVSGAIIRIANSFDTTTNATGEVLYRGGGESFAYTVKGPDGSDYIIQTGEVSKQDADGSITAVNISLVHGVKLTGKVTSKGNNIKEADVFIDGKEYITTKTRDDGNYTLYIPEGENTVKATKQDYVGKSVNKKFTASAVENFELEDGNGKNISKLLGFDIELENRMPDGAGEKWTGSFIKLKSNSAFSVSGTTKIKFTNIKVTFDAAGNPLVTGNEVKTDVTELSMKLFGYVPVKIKGAPQITVRKEVDGKGSIGGKVQMDLDQIAGGGGILFDSYVKPLLVPSNAPVDKDVVVFISDGSLPSNMNFSLAYASDEIKKAGDKVTADFQKKIDNAKGSAKSSLQAKLTELKNAQYASVKIYGFEGFLNLNKCNIDQTGLDMAGAIVSPDLPIISAMVFDIEKLKIGTDFSIKNLSVKSNVNLKFSIVNWAAEINSVGFNMNGFKVGGKIDIEVPKSPKTTMEFVNLGVGTSNVYGGSFTLPSAGLNVFDIIKLQSGSTPITFGEIGNTGVYKVGGSAKFSFGKLFSETLEVPYFQVQTDGKFAITVPVNKSLNAGFAKFSLNSIGFNTTGTSPQIDVNGQFSADVKLIKFTAGNIHFKTSGFSVDKIGIGLDIPGTKVDGFVDIKENGFAGGGTLSIVGTPVKAAIDFHYFKTPGGVDLGAKFLADVKIPIGIVIITKVGGGFSYRSNPEFFSVNITGGASITGFETAVSLEPISITVESGPKIIGEAHLKLASTFDVAKASLVIDIPNSLFAIGISADIDPVPDMVRAHVQGDLIISGKKGDAFFFLGCGMDVNLLGLIRSRGVFAIGAGVNNAKTRETVSYYLNDAPDQYLSNGSFSGIYVKAKSEVGIREQDAFGFDIGIAALKLWLYNSSDNFIIANFNNANFMISSSMYFEGGIRACLVGICATASAKACVGMNGGYSNAQGWNFAASASGEGTLGIGHSCGCNDICIGAFYAGGKICVGAGAKIRYESRTGGLKELSMFLGERARCD